MGSELSATITRARDLAQRRREPVSTTHLLLALFQTDPHVASVLQQQGVSEAALLSLLAAQCDEQRSAIDLAVERANRLAAVAGANHTLPLHLLLGVVRERRSAASTALSRAGLSPAQLTAATLGALGQPALTEVGQSARGGRSQRAYGPSLLRVRPHVRFRSLALSQETEAKLQRTRGGAGLGDGAPPDLGDPAAAVPCVDQQSQPGSVVLLRRGSCDAPRDESADRTRPSTGPSGAERGCESEHALDPQRFPLLTSIGRNLTLQAARGQIDPVIGRDREIEKLFDVLARRRGNNPLLVGAPGVGKTSIVEGLALALTCTDPALPASPARILVEISASSLLSGTGVRGALSERVQALRSEVALGAGRVLLFIDEIHCLLGGGEADSLGNELKTALARAELPVIGATTDAEYRKIFERDAALARRFTRIEVDEPSRADCLSILRALAPKYADHHGVGYDDAALSLAIDLAVRYLPLRQLPDKAIALLDQAGSRARRLHRPVVDTDGVAAVVSELARVPLDRLLMNDRQVLLGLERHLETRVVGQIDAAVRIGQALRKSAAGFRGQRPLGTFLFLGPTGVGKTEMAKAISELLFPGIPLTRIDMSELGQAHGVARLLGAPPGYIGHEDGGQLTEAVRHRPYQLVLLDEIEKAHTSVLLALLPLLDEGRLTDGRGRTVDFTNTVIIMTSNLGAEGALARARIGFGEATAPSTDAAGRALQLVRAALAPELFNRIDEPLYFSALTRQDVAEIARRMLDEVARLLRAQHQIDVEVAHSAVDALLCAGGFDPQLGARPMRRVVGRLVESPLARALLAGELRGASRVRLEGEGAQIAIRRLDRQSV